MILGIDASNIRAGGGVTHLVELLRAADPSAHGFSQIIVWSGQNTLTRIEDRPWLVKSHQPILDKGLLFRIFWQRFGLSKLVRNSGCDILFVPGGSYAGNFRPIVTMSQNLLPFEFRELRRYGWSFLTIKMLILRWTQSHSFRRADGVIFLTKYAQNAVMHVLRTINGQTSVVPHGIDGQFSCPPRKQLAVTKYTINDPFRILYVSVVDQYKHQWSVSVAVAALRKSGIPVQLDLVGPASNSALKKLLGVLEQLDPSGQFLRYYGPVPHGELHKRYTTADAFVFASSCETFGQILVEAMSSGLPIACSNKSAMPELLGDSGVYFDPERPSEIAGAIKTLFENPDLRSRLASDSFEKSKRFSWVICATATFSFIGKVAVASKVEKVSHH